MEDEGRTMHMPAIKWDFNAYTIMTVIGATLMNYAVMSYRVEANEKEIARVKSDVLAFDKVSGQLVMNDANFSIRLNNVIEGIQEGRRATNEQAIIQAKTNSEVLTQLSAIREMLAWFRATLESNGAPRQPQSQRKL